MEAEKFSNENDLAKNKEFLNNSPLGVGGRTPKELGYHFPAEFAKHDATWLSWPHKEASWPGKINAIYPYYSQFIKELTKGEIVRINVNDEAMKAFAIGHLQKANVDLDKVEFYFN